MKRIRLLSIAIFVITVVMFGLYKFNNWRSQDYAAPVIKMNEETITVSSSATEEQLLAGIAAEDRKDGDVTDSLIVESMSNFIEKGRRNITIAAFDSDNHVTKMTREVIYSDYTSPQFTLNHALRFPKNTNTILEGLGVMDVLDGNLTSNIKMSSDYYLAVDEVGEYPMVFSVVNSAGDVEELPVTVEIYDTAEESRRPQITLSEYIVYTHVGNPINPWDYVKIITWKGIEFVRGEDGILRDADPEENQEWTSVKEKEVDILQDVDYTKPGVYEITYQIEIEENEPGTVRLIVVVRE